MKFEKQNVSIVSKYFPTKYSLVTKGKRATMEERPGRHHLKQVIKVSIIGNGIH